MTKMIVTKDFFRNEKTFAICWETVCMGYTFAVGIDTTEPNEVSIFYVTNNGLKDDYEVLDTCFWDVYQKYNFSFEEKVKKEMSKVIKGGLTRRLKSGKITVEQIERMAKG